MSYSIYSTLYLENNVINYNCYLQENEWRRITNDITTSRIFARIVNGDKSWIVALGQPIRSNIDDPKALFVPRWMLDQIDVEGAGEPVEIQWMPSDVFDKSQHIVLKQIVSTYDGDSIQEYLSNEFTLLGILQKNTIIHINENIYEVVNLTPASIVLCEGDEVSLEFESPELFRTAIRAPSPYPFETLPALLFPENDEAPENIKAPDAPVLGGIKRFNPWRSKDFKPPNM